LRNPRNCQIVIMQKNSHGRYELISQLATRSNK
jgi:hypothetical protein